METSISQETVIRHKKLDVEEGVYLYTLKSSIGRNTASFGIRLYSISIEFTGADGVKTFAEAREYFSNRERAIAFFDRLVKYRATPINLPYIIEDEMS